MNRTTWIIIALVCILGLGGLVFMTKKDAVNVETVDPGQIIQPTELEIGDHVYGNKDAKVIVFEYADFQCPACYRAHPKTEKIQSVYKDKVAFVFRNFPLTSAHPNAMAAATAAEAAGLQNKYWEMNQLLFLKHDEWSSLSVDERGPKFLDYAREIGLNTDTFTTDLSSQKIFRKINSDLALGRKLDVGGTPSFFINDLKMDDKVVSDVIGSQGVDLMNKIDEALKAAGQTPPSRS